MPVQDFAAADLDGDGDLDVVVVYEDTIFNKPPAVLYENDGFGRFSSARELEIRDNAQAVHLADLDENGLSDVIVLSENPDVVAIFHNVGGGVFLPPVRVLVGDEPRSLASGDYDGDGDLDVFTANEGDGTLSVISNLGGGAYSVEPVPVESDPEWVRAADVDDDGDADLVVAHSRTNRTVLYENLGGSGLADPVLISAVRRPGQIWVGHLDGDSFIDLIVPGGGGSDDEIRVFYGDGGGGFGDQFVLKTDTFPTELAIADLNGDGRRDVIASSNFQTVMLLADGERSLRIASRHEIGIIVGVVAAPLDTIGGDDLLFADGVSGPIFVASGDADGRLRLPARIRVPSTFDANPLCVAPADLNGDGWVDLAVALESSRETVAISINRFGTFESDARLIDVGSSAVAIGTGDFDSDGDTDLATANATGHEVGLFFNEGEAAFNFTALALPERPRDLGVGDIDGDGRADIVVTYGFMVEVLRGDGAGGFETFHIEQLGDAAIQVELVDGDDDGDLDIYVQWPTHVSTLHNEGGVLRRSDASLGDVIHELGVGDLNGDGLADLVAALKNSRGVFVHWALGDDLFSEPERISSRLACAGEMVVRDSNLDGHMDVVAACDTFVVEILGDGAGGFWCESGFGGGADPEALAFADFDRDGDGDVAITSNDGNTINIRAGSGVRACPADLTGSSDRRDDAYGVPDGSVDADDFFYFLDRFSEGHPAADINLDGVVDSADFFGFLDLYAIGCG